MNKKNNKSIDNKRKLDWDIYGEPNEFIRKVMDKLDSSLDENGAIKLSLNDFNEFMKENGAIQIPAPNKK